MEQVDIFMETLKGFWTEFAAFVPSLLAAIILLIGGWIVARILRRAFLRIFKLLRLDVIAEKSGIEDFLLKGGVRFTAVTLLAALVYWFVLFATFLGVLNILGLEVAAELLNRVVLYIPKVVVAVFVLIFGVLFAKLVGGAAYTYLSNVGIEGARLTSTVAEYAILFFVGSVALEQLGIGGEILVSAFQIAFGALCLALAIAFGLGGKEWASRFLESTFKK
ncbi:MAG: hypothetical protein WBG01_04905 [Bacteroidota bacterium]